MALEIYLVLAINVSYIATLGAMYSPTEIGIMLTVGSGIATMAAAWTILQQATKANREGIESLLEANTEQRKSTENLLILWTKHDEHLKFQAKEIDALRKAFADTEVPKFSRRSGDRHT